MYARSSTWLAGDLVRSASPLPVHLGASSSMRMLSDLANNDNGQMPVKCSRKLAGALATAEAEAGSFVRAGS